MRSGIDQHRNQFQDISEELIRRIKLLRDYATTPHSAWLAEDELYRIQALIQELEQHLAEIKRLERD